MPTKLIAFDAKTRVITGEIPYNNFSYTSQLNGKGSWSAVLPMSHVSNGFELMNASTFSVGRTQFAFVRDGVPLFVGFQLQEVNDLGEMTDNIQVGGPDGVMGPLEKVQLWSHLVVNTEQFLIVKALVDRNPPFIYQDFGIVVAYDAVSGVVKQRDYQSSSRPTSAKLIDDLADTENGFDYLVELAGSQASGFVPTLRLGYPELRRKTGIVVDLAKNVHRMRRDVDGSSLANAYTVLGQGAGTDRPTLAYAFNNAAFSVYPEMDGSESRSTVVVQSTLQGYANQGAKLYGFPLDHFTVEVDVDDPDLRPGAFRLGDEVRLIAHKGRVDVDAVYRIMNYTLMGDISGSERLSLTLTPADRSS